MKRLAPEAFEPEAEAVELLWVFALLFELTVEAAEAKGVVDIFKVID